MNCEICKTHCCGGSPLNPPVLMPYEEEVFKDVSYKDGDMYRIKRNEKGLCIFLNEQNRCSIYSVRPLECRIYPYILSYKNDVLDVELHGGCPQKDTANKPQLPSAVHNLPWWWLRGYEKLET